MVYTTKVVGVICALALLCAILAGEAQGGLLLNEILSSPDSDWDGDGLLSSRDDEWVEIVNTGPGSEALDGLYLRDGTGTAFHFGFSGSLEPGEVLIVFGKDAYAWQQANGAGSSGLSLNNTGDLVELVRDTGDPDLAAIVDAVQVPSQAAANERALGRAPGGGRWLLLDGLSPYSGTAEPGATGCAPTPSLANDCSGIVPVHSIGMGGLKAKY
ncbi:MAG TPA: lamin tail domain-containing protein [Candidatus Krumholzibacteria bacterium]|jgi:hypothetical protein